MTYTIDDNNTKMLLDFVTSYYGTAVRVIAKHCGIEYDEYVQLHEKIVAKIDLYTDAWRRIKKGSVSAAPSVNLIPQVVEAKAGFLDALDFRGTQVPFSHLLGFF